MTKTPEKEPASPGPRWENPGRDQNSEPLAPDFKNALQEAYDRSSETRDRFDRAGLRPSELNIFEDLYKLPSTSAFNNSSASSAENYGWTGVLASAGITAHDVVMISLEPQMAGLIMALDRSLAEIGARSLPSGMANLDIQMGVLRDLEVKFLISSPEFLRRMAEKITGGGTTSSKEYNLEAAVLVGEDLDDGTRNDLEGTFGLEILKARHTQGLYCLGYECKHRAGYHWPENLFVDIVDPESGQTVSPDKTGEMIVTALSFPDPPLVRFNTGVSAFFADAPCPCGRDAYQVVFRKTVPA